MVKRTASRGTALTIRLGLGLFASVVVLIWMLIDQITTDTVSAHNNELFSPLVSFLIGTGLLLFIFFITEYDFPALADSPIFPTGWRVTCLSMAIYGVIVMLIAWLPTTDRIRK